MIHMPMKIPGLRPLTVLWGIYAAVWITLEGALWRVIVMGVGVTAVATATLIQKYMGGKRLPAWKWMGVTAVTGLAIGFFSAILTLVFMAVKTGLHAHGPEFRPQEISWLIQQIPFWTTGGFLAGLGVGLIRTGTSDQ
jgi:hypothetical protein